VIDSTGLGLHHIVAQSLVRAAGAGHGPANAAVLPHTIGALATRTPQAIAALDAAVHGEQLAATEAHDTPPAAPGLVAVARHIGTRAGATSLRAIGVEEAALGKAADAAAARPQLANTPPPATRDEILELYRAAL
jgi:alcohol dehydrogenase class IV